MDNTALCINPFIQCHFYLINALTFLCVIDRFYLLPAQRVDGDDDDQETNTQQYVLGPTVSRTRLYRMLLLIINNIFSA